MQKVEVKAGFSFDSADDLIRFLIKHGFDVKAQYKGNVWEIKAVKGQLVTGGSEAE